MGAELSPMPLLLPLLPHFYTCIDQEARAPPSNPHLIIKLAESQEIQPSANPFPLTTKRPATIRTALR